MKHSTVIDILLSGVASFRKGNPAVPSGLVDTIEGLTRANNADGFGLWENLNKLIGEHYADGWQHVLISIRNQFVKDLIVFEKARLDNVFKESTETGTREWLTLITTSITQFNDFFPQEFCQFQFPFPANYSERVIEVKEAVKYIINSCWADAYPAIEYLSSLNFLSEDLRIHLLIIQGEIQQYHYGKPYKAQVFYQKAGELAPNHFRVVGSLGSYYMSEKKTDLAQAQFEKLIKLYPNRSGGYHGMAEVAEAKSETSEHWYLEAIKQAAGDTSVYIKLVRYYVKTHKQDLEREMGDLKRRLLAVGPDMEYSYWMDVGFEYFDLKQFDVALQSFEKAIDFDQTLSRAFLQIGYTHLATTVSSRYDTARLNFHKVIDLSPQSIYGFWAMAHSFSQENRYEEMLSWYARTPRRILDYRDKIYASMGQAYLQLGDYEHAEEQLTKAFAEDNQSEWAKFYMEQLAKAYYEKKNNREKAISLYASVLNNLGELYRASYENRVGNVHYYYGEYEEAAAHYQNAMAHGPDDILFKQNLSAAYNAIGNRLFKDNKFQESVKYYERALQFDSTYDIYHSNLSGAHEQSGDLAKALEHLQKARELNPTGDYANKITTIQTEIEFLPKYGEKAMRLASIVTPIAIEVASNLIPLLSQGSALTPNFLSSINVMRDAIQEKFGHERIPGIRVRGNETDLPDGDYIIMLDEIPRVSGHVSVDGVLCNATVEQLAASNIPADKMTNPANGTECAWVSPEFTDAVRKLGIQTWDTAAYIMLHLLTVINKNFSGFVTLQTVSNQLRKYDFYEKISTAVGGVSRFTNVLKGLVEEGVSIRELSVLCETYLMLTIKGYPLYVIIEELRNHTVIRQSLNQTLAGSDYCPVYELGEDLVKAITDSVYTSGDGALLAIEPEPTQEILTAVRNEVSNTETGSQNPVVMIKDWKLRRHMRKLLELEFPYLSVLAEREITKSTKTLATIKVAGN